MKTELAGWWSLLLARHRLAMGYATSEPGMAWAGGVVVVGYVIGVYAAYEVCRMLPVFAASLEEARRLGIVLSITILSGYSKSAEFVVYVVSQIIVFLTVVGVWWGWCVWRSYGVVALPGAQLIPPSAERRAIGTLMSWLSIVRGLARTNPRWVDWVLVPIVVVFVAFDIDRFTLAWQGASGFLYEEGTFLSAVDGLLRGGVLYRDDYAGYAPLMFYPVKWLMGVFGVNGIILRLYTFISDVAGFIVLYHVLRVCLRHRGWALAGLGFFLVNYSLVYGVPGTIYRPSIHQSVFRYVIGLAWLIFFLRERPLSRLNRFMAGVAIGLALTFSHEVGLAACVAFLIVVMAAPAWGEQLRASLANIPLVVAGAVTVLTPWVVYFAGHRSLTDVAYWLLIYPQYMSLGYANLPFPSLGDLWWAIPNVFQWSPSPQALSIAISYWVPAMISLGVVVLGMRWCLGNLDREDQALFALVLMGGMLFKTALARTDIVHVQLPLVPVVLLGMIILRRFIDAAILGSVPLRSLTFAVMLGGAIVSVVVIQPPWPVLHAFVQSNVTSVRHKVIEDGLGIRSVSGIPRAQGMRFPIPFADEFEKTVKYIVTHTGSDEPILAFPNEPAYYFFADRANATRYPTASSAVTRSDRVAMIGELNESRPKYLIYSLGTPRIDNLRDDVVFPELMDYIRRHYIPEQRFGKTIIMKRQDVGAVEQEGAQSKS